MSIKAIESYYKSNVYKPFFMAVGDDEYRFLKAKLVDAGDVVFVRLSSCCRNADKKPDMDKLRETLRMADVDCDSNKIVLLGLGEYLALEGPAFAKKILNETDLAILVVSAPPGAKVPSMPDAVNSVVYPLSE